MFSTRCKFHLDEVHQLSWGGRKLVFSPSYDSEIPEDQRFCKATPSGCFEMTLSSDDNAARFELGKYYYFDISPVPVAAPAAA